MIPSGGDGVVKRKKVEKEGVDIELEEDELSTRPHK